jgi:hypothetical protein
MTIELTERELKATHDAVCNLKAQLYKAAKKKFPRAEETLKILQSVSDKTREALTAAKLT